MKQIISLLVLFIPLVALGTTSPLHTDTPTPLQMSTPSHTLSNIPPSSENNTLCTPAKTGNPCSSTSRAPTLNLGAGNPIHLISGNKFQHEQDLLLRLSGLEFSRYYNAMAPISTTMGIGWSHAYNTRLFHLPRAWQILLDDGQRIMFETPNTTATSSDSQTSDAYSTGIKQEKKLRLMARIPQQGYLQQNSLQEWEWHTPEGTIRTFNKEGYLRQLIIAGFPTISIDYQTLTLNPNHLSDNHVSTPLTDTSHSQNIPSQTSPTQIVSNSSPNTLQPTSHLVIQRVYNRQEEIRFYYDSSARTPLISHIETPVGIFRYSYDIPQGFSNYRLTKVLRADGWQREYLYEPQHQAGNPYRLTGITLTTPQQQRLRINEWHYQADGKAIYSRSKNTALAPTLPNISSQALTDEHELHIHYARQAINENDESLTIIRDQHGHQTRITGIIKGGNYLLKEVSGMGCHLCPPTGTRATYNAKGQLQSINGFNLYRDAQGRVQRIDFQHPAWDKVTLDYDEQGYAKQWHTQITGTRLPGPPALVKIALPQPQQDTDLAYFQQDQLVFKNGLHLKQMSRGDRHKLLVLEKEGKPLWIQTRAYNTKGLLEKEQFLFLLLDKQIENHYLYDKNFRLIGALQKEGEIPSNFSKEYQDNSSTSTMILSSRKQHHTKTLPPSSVNQYNAATTNRIKSIKETLFYYAWNNDGSSKAYAFNHINIHPRILRDKQGLPLTVDKKKLFYGKQNRIETILEGQQIIAQYRYDTYGRRLQKITKTKRIDFQYKGNQLDVETLSAIDTNVKKQRHYIYRGIMPVAFTESLLDKEGKTLSTATFFIHNDHLGLPIMVSDEQQNIRWAAYYSPTGKATQFTGDIEFNLRQPGQYFDAETGWHDNYLRTYDPEAGHYLEPDPLGPLAWNDPYGYVAQQPRQFIDPTGLILFAFDGTTNNPASETNVWKFYQLYQGPKFYTEGPGAIPGESVHDAHGGALFGTTASLIIDKQKQNFINYMRTMHNNFTDITPIDIVGFSRGAMMGMVFSNYVRTLVKDGLFTYQETIVEDGREHIQDIRSCVDLRFIGLFDTVAQLGLNGVYNHRVDYTAAPEWQIIAHAIALNEYRSVLPLTVYQGADNVVEQGFLGNHSDLGGVLVKRDLQDLASGFTSLHDRAYGDLGDIPLAWIYTQAQQIGVALRPLDSIKVTAGRTWSDPQKGRLDEVRYPFMHNTYGEYAKPITHNPYTGVTNNIPSNTRVRDRELQMPNTNVAHQKQGENPHIGDRIRQEHIKAAEVEFLWAKTEELTMADVSIYGKLNAEKYIAWLEQELNWKSPVKAVRPSNF
ncbi:phospholipase effector Tle1 domain-containing protein [Pelistega europaea]|uniref:DUF2235 domain-containing protein n=1 Tax=Pelistega europaea TaxID=106147 RepID=A0A7Y4L7Z7_9BURK|nr:DUF2235 domain-containing protein [Pelistega europaea]NOL48617.1 hypothetical protein [Pelistega europaea]